MKLYLLFYLSVLLSCTSLAQSPVIIYHPQDKDICPGSCAELRVEAAPIGQALNYQWQILDNGNFVDIAIEATPFHSQNDTFQVCLDAIGPEEFRCVVSNAIGSDTSDVAVVSAATCEPPVANFTFDVYGDSVCFTNTSTGVKSVLWNFGDNGQSSQVDPCHDYEDYQVFYVRLYVYNDYGNDSIEKAVSTMGIDDDLKSDGFTLYPNPASGPVNVTLPADGKIKEVYVTDMPGNIIRLKTFLTTQKLQVQTAQLERGIYQLHMVMEREKVVKTFIKQ